jgi:hypothetical protein
MHVVDSCYTYNSTQHVQFKTAFIKKMSVFTRLSVFTRIVPTRGFADKLLLLPLRFCYAQGGEPSLFTYLVTHILRERVQVAAYRESLQGVHVLVIYRCGGLSGIGTTSENHRGRRHWHWLREHVLKLILYNYFRRLGTLMLTILTINKQWDDLISW